MVFLSVSNLGALRGGSWLFRGLNFSVPAGRLLWVRGANGSGKTTLLRILANLGRADEGEVTQGDDEKLPSKLYVGHANALKDDLTVLEALQFLTQLHGQQFDTGVLDEALTRLGMHHRRHAMVKTLSQGQRRRVALARLALATAPGVWILDEPFDALDTAGIQAVCELMLEHGSRSGSVVYTSHVAAELPADSLHLDDNRT